ncbi:response regulator transcription factor [Kitasatospora sp. NPDC088391]|uniref:response regulator transcription factor n=1 Tax=Kitasatospora sp. NPDC088391 TaxID=3364074 RepID=UPI00380346A7
MPPAPLPSTPAADSFSCREQQVLRLIGEGFGYAAIARRLGLSPHTVDTYLRRIRAKTGMTTQVQLALLAHRLPELSAP